MRLMLRTPGFSLIEATVAVGLLALGCVAITVVLHVSLRAQARDRARCAVTQALDAETARLRALPFFARAGGPGEGPSSLVAEVFPHARPWLNSDGAWFQAADGPGGAFVSVAEVGGLRIRRTARFVRETAGGREPLDLVDEHGWAVWDGVRPPAIIIVVRLDVLEATTATGTRELVLSGLRAPFAPVSSLDRGDRGVC
jgi:hypothetical protein